MISTINREDRIVIIAILGHFLTHMSILIFPAITVPLSRELGLSLSESFMLGFLMYFLYGAFAILVGFIADRWSRLQMLRLCIAGIGLFSIMAGLMSNITLFVISLAGLGLSCSLYHPAGLGLISNEIKKQGNAHGINGVFGSLGIGAAPLLAGSVMLFLNWRYVYIITGILALIGLSVTYILSFKESEKGAKSNFKSSVNPNVLYFVLLAIAMMFAGFAYRANMTILPAYFLAETKLIIDFLSTNINIHMIKEGDVGYANLLVASLLLFSIVGQYIGGKLADIYDLRKTYLIFQSLSLPFAFGMWLFSDIGLYIAAGMHLFFALGMQPLENSLLSKFVPQQLLSTAYGIKFTLTFGVGSLAVYQVAWIEQLFQLRDVYILIMAQLILVIIFAALLLTISKRKHSFIGNRKTV
ncbi:MAG: MFS transporter [Nitrospinota bacterium]